MAKLGFIGLGAMGGNIAARLLESGDYKIFEVANMVGYSSQSQLGRNFLKQFGITPTEYQQSKRGHSARSLKD